MALLRAVRGAAMTLLAAAAAHAQGPPDAAKRCVTEPPERAVAICRDAVRAMPGDLTVRRSLAAALTARGDTLAAVDELREITRRDPYSAQAQLDLATGLDRLGRSDEAL
ncbi:MAG TPA: hypothetical protein VFZ21_04335, partial [Gemmatimonadaceae bacterium]|nr:hypothetical protein [Gemmatimonadaceae bacterium]